MRYLIIIIFFLTSCRTTKDVNKEFTKRELSVDSVAKVDSNSTKVSLEEKVKENDNSIEFFDAPIAYMTDTVFVPKIIYKADGSFEATGVKKVNLKSIEWQKKYDSLNNEYNLEINKRLALEEELKAKVKEKIVKVAPSGWWVLIVIILSIVTWEILKRKVNFK